jgi:hypothetical protein
MIHFTLESFASHRVPTVFYIFLKRLHVQSVNLRPSEVTLLPDSVVARSSCDKSAEKFADALLIGDSAYKSSLGVDFPKENELTHDDYLGITELLIYFET